MSQENVVVVRTYLETPLIAEEADTEVPEDLAAWVAEFWEPDGDYYPIRGFPEAQPCHGREDIVDFLTGYIAAWERYRYVVNDARTIGDDRVFVHGHFWAEGRSSGVAQDSDLYHCFWLRHGRFIRSEDHLTAKGALHALGLTAETLEAAGLRE